MIFNIASACDSLTKEYNSENTLLKEKSTKTKEELKDEMRARLVYLNSISMELNRILSDFKSKEAFIKEAFKTENSADFIGMYIQFQNYVAKEIVRNSKLLQESNIDMISKKMTRIEKKSAKIE